MPWRNFLRMIGNGLGYELLSFRGVGDGPLQLEPRLNWMRLVLRGLRWRDNRIGYSGDLYFYGRHGLEVRIERGAKAAPWPKLGSNSRRMALLEQAW
jgi:hypothetical protein